MIGVEMAMEIRVLAKHGMGVREIARGVGMSRNTVRRYLRDEEAVRYKERPPRSAKPDPHKTYIAASLPAAAPETIEANVLLEEIRARGYAGGLRVVKAHVAALRARAVPEPVVRFETAPGQPPLGGVDGVTAPRRHRCARVGSRRSDLRVGHVGDYHCRARLATNVFQVHGADGGGQLVLRKKLRCAQVLEFFGQLPSCVVAMEACGGAHFWGREIGKLGHDVRLIPSACVKPLAKRQKNDGEEDRGCDAAA